MERTLVTVNPEGQLIVPSEISSALGFSAGTEVEISVSGDHLTLSRKRVPMSRENIEKLIADLQAAFKGGPSLEDDLYKMRREEEEHSKRKFS